MHVDGTVCHGQLVSNSPAVSSVSLPTQMCREGDVAYKCFYNAHCVIHWMFVSSTCVLSLSLSLSLTNYTLTVPGNRLMNFFLAVVGSGFVSEVAAAQLVS